MIRKNSNDVLQDFVDKLNNDKVFLSKEIGELNNEITRIESRKQALQNQLNDVEEAIINIRRDIRGVA